MARLPRFDLPGHLHLLIQRARESHPAFVDDQDRRRYLAALQESARESGVAVHAYALTDGQVLLLATPTEPGALARFMQAVGRRYVKAFNHRHGRRGSPWSGRYRTTVIDPVGAALDGMRLVEQTPVRLGLVGRALEWAWSSAAHHAGRRRDAVVVEHPGYWRLGNTPFEREARYLQQLDISLAADKAQVLLDAALHGWPLGSDEFMRDVAQGSARPVRRRPRGRPAKAI